MKKNFLFLVLLVSLVLSGCNPYEIKKPSDEKSECIETATSSIGDASEKSAVVAPDIDTMLRVGYGDLFINEIDKLEVRYINPVKQSLALFQPSLTSESYFDPIKIAVDEFIDVFGGLGNKIEFDEFRRLFQTQVAPENEFAFTDYYWNDIHKTMCWIEYEEAYEGHFKSEVFLDDETYTLTVLTLVNDDPTGITVKGNFFFLSDGDESILCMVLPYTGLPSLYRDKHDLYLITNQEDSAAWIVSSTVTANGGGGYKATESWYNLLNGNRDISYSYQAMLDVNSDVTILSKYVSSNFGYIENGERFYTVISDQFLIRAQFAFYDENYEIGSYEIEYSFMIDGSKIKCYDQRFKQIEGSSVSWQYLNIRGTHGYSIE